jgi:general secretion pathway protein L
LKQALPHLVEDQLMSDPAESILVASASQDGVRTVAAMRRDALLALANYLRAAGARDVIALPAQLCLPLQADCAHAVVLENHLHAELMLRMSEHAALGLPVLSDHIEQVPTDALQTLQALWPQGVLTVHVDRHALPAFQIALAAQPELHARTSLATHQWQHWIDGTKAVTLNLLSALQPQMQQPLDWRAWRWPLVLGAAMLSINVVGVNLQWWHLKTEAQSLRTAMTDIYRTAYPKEKIIVDPVLQMQQKLAAAKRLSGQLASDDFLSLSAAFGDAWNSIHPEKSDNAFSKIEYRDHALLVTPKAGNDDLTSQLKPALATRNLSLSQADAGTWQIGVVR